MALTLVYKRKNSEKKDVTLDNMLQLGQFIYGAQPLEVIAIRDADTKQKDS